MANSSLIIYPIEDKIVETLSRRAGSGIRNSNVILPFKVMLLIVMNCHEIDLNYDITISSTTEIMGGRDA